MTTRKSSIHREIWLTCLALAEVTDRLVQVRRAIKRYRRAIHRHGRVPLQQLKPRLNLCLKERNGLVERGRQQLARLETLLTRLPSGEMG